MRLLVALVLLAAAPAFAQNKYKDPQEDSASGGATAPRPSFQRDEPATRALFERLDKNKDGHLTGSELTSDEAATTNWIAVDRDNDGRIGRTEFTAVQPGDIAATPRP